MSKRKTLVQSKLKGIGKGYRKVPELRFSSLPTTVTSDELPPPPIVISGPYVPLPEPAVIYLKSWDHMGKEVRIKLVKEYQDTEKKRRIQWIMSLSATTSLSTTKKDLIQSLSDYSKSHPLLKDLYRLCGPLSFWTVVLSHVNVPLWSYCLAHPDFLPLLKHRIRILILFLQQHLSTHEEEYVHFIESDIQNWYRQALEQWIVPSHEIWRQYLVVQPYKYGCINHHVTILQFLEGGAKKFRLPIPLLVQLSPTILTGIRHRMLPFTIDQWKLIISIHDEEAVQWAFLHNFHCPAVRWKAHDMISKCMEYHSIDELWMARIWQRLLHGSSFHCLYQLKSTVVARCSLEQTTNELAAIRRPNDPIVETKEQQMDRVRNEVIQTGIPCTVVSLHWDRMHQDLAIDLYWMGVRSNTLHMLMADLKYQAFSLMRESLSSVFPKDIANAIFNALPQTHVLNAEKKEDIEK